MDQATAVLEVRESKTGDLFLLGRRQVRLFDIAGYREAVALFLEAREVEPDWARITAALAETYALWGFRREISGKECLSYYEMAFDEASRALEAGPDLSDTHRAMAKALRMGPHADPARRLSEISQAVKLNPYDVESCHELWCATGSRLNDPVIFKVMALDGQFFPAPHDLGVAFGAAGRLQEALFYFDKALGIIPQHALALCNRAVLLANAGRAGEADAMLRAEADLEDPLVIRALSEVRQQARPPGRKP